MMDGFVAEAVNAEGQQPATSGRWVKQSEQ
jgi:hypothetical protein